MPVRKFSRGEGVPYRHMHDTTGGPNDSWERNPEHVQHSDWHHRRREWWDSDDDGWVL